MQRQGVDVIHYALNKRFENAGAWLEFSWKRAKCALPRPTQGDAMYLACAGMLERALRHNVDWVVAVSGFYIHPDVLIMLRRARIKIALVFTESPYEDEGQAKHAQYADVIWVNDRASVAKFSQVHSQVYYWQHAIDPARHMSSAQPGDEEMAAHDMVFVGTGFIERINMLRDVNWDGIDLGLYGTWGMVGSRNRLRRYIRGGITKNAGTSALYRRAKIGLNLHRTSVESTRDTAHESNAESMNPRGYELAAAGLFYLSDYRSEVAEIFGDAVPTFRSPGELEELVRYYLAHPEEREQRARRLPELVGRHTFDARVSDMLRILERLGKG